MKAEKMCYKKLEKQQDCKFYKEAGKLQIFKDIMRYNRCFFI